MPNFQLHYITADGDRLEDLSESEFEDLLSARRHAVLIGRDILSERLRAGLPVDGGHIEIKTDDGHVVARIELIDAARRHPDIDAN